MAERRRRASTSSVDTVDGSLIHWLQETSVVRSVPSLSDPDGWPCFELHDVVVYDRQGKTLDNPLYASTRGPFTVRGRLTITDPSQKAFMISRVGTSTPIEIRGCGRYCIGLESVGDASSPQIWVAGKGGWYEIVPAEEYMPIYSKMCEATIMYFSIFDYYAPDYDEQEEHEHEGRPLQKAASKHHGGRLERLYDVFLKYVVSVGDGSTLDEVVERCRDHAPFLIAQFTQETSPRITWSETDFYGWVMHEFADVAKQVEELILRPNTDYTPPPAPPPPPVKAAKARQSTRSASLEDASPVPPTNRAQVHHVPERPKPKPKPQTASGDAVVVQPASVPVPDPGVPWTYETALDTVVAALEDVYEKRGQSKKGLVTLTTLNSLYFDFKFPNWKDGTPGCHKVPVIELLHYHAKGLLERLDRAKYERHEIYGYLQELAQQEFKPVSWKVSDYPLRLVHRNPSQRQSKQAEAPTSSAAANSANFKITTAATALDVDTDEEGQISRPMGKSIRRPGQRSRKSGLRTMSQASKKRGFAELHSGSDSEGSALKKSHFFADEDALDGDFGMGMGMDMDTDMMTPDKQLNGSTEDEDDDDAAAAAHEEPMPVVVRVERIPSTKPRGPDGTWTCDQPGCDHVVRGGDEDEIQDRIQEHFEEHERQAKRLNLVVTESTRGHVPLNHLLEKLKRMGEKPSQGRGGPRIGPGIKRRLIV